MARRGVSVSGFLALYRTSRTLSSVLGLNLRHSDISLNQTLRSGPPPSSSVPQAGPTAAYHTDPHMQGSQAAALALHRVSEIFLAGGGGCLPGVMGSASPAATTGSFGVASLLSSAVGQSVRGAASSAGGSSGTDSEVSVIPPAPDTAVDGENADGPHEIDSDDIEGEEADEPIIRKNEETGEVDGPRGLEPTRYGDWEKGGRCYDF